MTVSEYDDIKEWVQEMAQVTISNDLFDFLSDGVALCQIANKIAGNSSACKYKISKMPFMRMENITNFLRFCESLGVPSNETFETVDLYERTNVREVAITIRSLSRHAHEQNESIPVLGPKLAKKNPRKSFPNPDNTPWNTRQYGSLGSGDSNFSPHSPRDFSTKINSPIGLRSASGLRSSSDNIRSLGSPRGSPPASPSLAAAPGDAESPSAPADTASTSAVPGKLHFSDETSFSQEPEEISVKNPEDVAATLKDIKISDHDHTDDSLTALGSEEHDNKDFSFGDNDEKISAKDETDVEEAAALSDSPEIVDTAAGDYADDASFSFSHDDSVLVAEKPAEVQPAEEKPSPKATSKSPKITKKSSRASLSSLPDVPVCLDNNSEQDPSKLPPTPITPTKNRKKKNKKKAKKNAAKAAAAAAASAPSEPIDIPPPNAAAGTTPERTAEHTSPIIESVNISAAKDIEASPQQHFSVNGSPLLTPADSSPILDRTYAEAAMSSPESSSPKRISLSLSGANRVAPKGPRSPPKTLSAFASSGAVDDDDDDQDEAPPLSPIRDEDAAVYAYDEVYDSMKSVEQSSRQQQIDSQSSQHVRKFLESKQIREQNRREAVEKMSEKDAEQFSDKEVFVTSAYREYKKKEQAKKPSAKLAPGANVFKSFLESESERKERMMDAVQTGSARRFEIEQSDEESGGESDSFSASLSVGLNVRKKPRTEKTGETLSDAKCLDHGHAVKKAKTDDSEWLSMKSTEHHDAASLDTESKSSTVLSARERYLARKAAKAQSSRK